jgi:nucleoside-diphosphate-sugar epimerase
MVLVTGAGGFLAHFVVRELVKKGVCFKGLIRDTQALRDAHFPYPVCFGDLGRPSCMQEAASSSTGVIHLACTLSTDAQVVERIDIRGMRALSAGWKEGNFLFASSMGVYPSAADKPLSESTAPAPENWYGLGKLISEEILRLRFREHLKRNSGVCCAVLRLPYILGAHPRFAGSLFGRLVQQALRGQDFILEDRHSGTSWVSASDLGGLIAGWCGRPFSGTFNVASGWISWSEAVEQVTRLTGSRSRVTYRRTGNTARRGRLLDTAAVRQHCGFIPGRSFVDEMSEIVTGMKSRTGRIEE